MKRCSLLLLIFASLHATAQSVKWHYTLKDVSFGQTNARDIDGDGRLELIFSTYWNDSNVYCLNAEDGSLKWKHLQKSSAGGCNDAGPLIFDPFNNGNYKVIIPGSCLDTTFCVDADSGYTQWKTVTGGGDSPPSAVDFNGDGFLDALHGTFYGNIAYLDGRTGALAYSLAVDGNAAIESEPTIVNNGGEMDFVCATWDFTYDSNRIACYSVSDHSLRWKYYVHNLLYHGPATGDLFRDGQKEVVIGDYDGYLYCLRASDGSLVWKDSVSKMSSGYIGAPVTLADLNSDGYLDIICSDGNSIRAVNRNDSALWTYTPPGDFTNFRGAVVADVNNDNIKDVTFCTNYGTVISLDGLTGSVIRSFDTHAYAVDSLGDTSSIYEVDNAPVIADFDNDGILDLFIIGGKGRSDSTTYNDYGYALCLSWGEGKGPDWLMFRHDERRTACLCDTSGLPLTVPATAQLPLVQPTIQPVPSQGPFEVRFTVAQPLAVTVAVFDLQGRLVLPVRNVSALSGANSCSFSASETAGLQAGSYFVRINAQGYSTTLPLVLVRQ